MKRLLAIMLCLCLLGLPGCGTVETEPEINSDVINSAPTGDIDKTDEQKQDDSFAGQSFEVHYIDVGQADSALVLCDGYSMLIDGGNPEDSNVIYSYLKKLQIDHLDYIVCSHAHADHVGGLSAPLSTMSVDTVYAPKTESDSKAYGNFKTKAKEQGLTIQNPQPGNSFKLGSSTVDFFGPITENVEDLNNTSIVLKITYGNTSFLFTGDAEREEEQDILSGGYDLSADVLKVGHHGSDSSTSYAFLREIMPKYAVISVGKDNSYGHPTDEVLSRLRDADVKVFRTDIQGDIIAKSDGETVTITPSKNINAETNTTTKAKNNQSGVQSGQQSDNDITYIGNKKSKKFHSQDCYSLPAEKNREYITGRDNAINQGYSPCGNCNP